MQSSDASEIVNIDGVARRVVTKKEALTLGLNYYFYRTCTKGHWSARWLATGCCIECDLMNRIREGWTEVAHRPKEIGIVPILALPRKRKKLEKLYERAFYKPEKKYVVGSACKNCGRKRRHPVSHNCLHCENGRKR